MPRFFARFATHALVAVLTVLGSAAAATAQRTADGDKFGGETSYWDGALIPALQGSAFCDVLMLLQWLIVGLALMLAMLATYRAAKGNSGQWKVAAVLVLVAGVLVAPDTLLVDVFGMDWLNDSIKAVTCNRLG